MAKSVTKAAKKTTKKKGGQTGGGKAKRPRAAVTPIPPGFATVSVMLTVRDGDRAIQFYKNAFGAKPGLSLHGPDGALMHGEVKIGDSTVMLSQEQPGGSPDSPKAPPSLGGSPCVVCLYVKNADKFVARAVEAGAKVTMPVDDQFWGDRYGQLVDPFGHTWAVATRIEKVTPKQMAKRMQAMFQN